MARPGILAESTWKTIGDSRYEVAVLPWGATEAHNYHLPYSTDTVECDEIGSRAVVEATKRGARIVLLPTVPFGVQTGQLDIPFCININPSTQGAILRDVARSLEPHGVRKLVILNGHGGNDFKQIIRELQPQTSLFLCQVNWYSVLEAKRYFDEPGDHAGELETSVMMHVAPELVAPLSDAGDGAVRKPMVKGMREGWAWAPRRWTMVSADTGVGNPSKATKEKGERYVAALTDSLAGFLVELDAMDPSSPYGSPDS